MRANDRREAAINKPCRAAIVAIAGSAGGLAAMFRILPCLPAKFPAPIVYLQHMNGSYRSALADVLQWHTVLNVRWAQHGDRLTAGVVYVCPPNCSLSITPDNTITVATALTRREILHGADRLFASVAASYAHRAVVVVLSGGCSDASDGVRAVHAQHGTVLVQDVASAFPSAFQWSMPCAAIATGCVDLVLRLEDIAPVLVNLVGHGHSLVTLQTNTDSSVERECMSASPQFHDTLNALLAIALKRHGTDLGNIQLFDRQTGNLAIVAQRGFGLDFLRHFRAVSEQDESACGRVLRAREPVLIADVTVDPLFAAHRDIAAAAGFRAVHSTPLISRDGTFLGVLSTHFRSAHHLSRAELQWLDRHRRATDLIEALAIQPVRFDTQHTHNV